MLTSLGRFLRKLRIDRGEILKNMAEKLNVSASFLSAVENGKKRMPSSWNGKICDLYELDEEQKRKFTKAIAETEEGIDINFANSNIERRELAVSFARKFADIDDEQAEAIRKILIGGTKE